MVPQPCSSFISLTSFPSLSEYQGLRADLPEKLAFHAYFGERAFKGDDQSLAICRHRRCRRETILQIEHPTHLSIRLQRGEKAIPGTENDRAITRHSHTLRHVAEGRELPRDLPVRFALRHSHGRIASRTRLPLQPPAHTIQCVDIAIRAADVDRRAVVAERGRTVDKKRPACLSGHFAV